MAGHFRLFELHLQYEPYSCHKKNLQLSDCHQQLVDANLTKTQPSTLKKKRMVLLLKMSSAYTHSNVYHVVIPIE